MGTDSWEWDLFDDHDDPPNEVTWARGRRPDRTYVSRSFALTMPASPDHGMPARYVTKVFDDVDPDAAADNTDDAEEWTVMTTPGGRVQLKLQVVREQGVVRKLELQRVPTRPDATKLERLLVLDRDGAGRLIELVRALDHIPVEGEQTVRVDDDLIRDLFTDPDAVQSLYRRDPQGFREAIKSDASARDLIALAHRRTQIERFRQLLTDTDYFESQRAAIGNVGRERVWQDYLEENPWILGVSLAGQLLTSWDDDKLEQTVAGFPSLGQANEPTPSCARQVVSARWSSPNLNTTKRRCYSKSMSPIAKTVGRHQRIYPEA